MDWLPPRLRMAYRRTAYVVTDPAAPAAGVTRLFRRAIANRQASRAPIPA